MSREQIAARSAHGCDRRPRCALLMPPAPTARCRSSGSCGNGDDRAGPAPDLLRVLASQRVTLAEGGPCRASSAPLMAAAPGCADRRRCAAGRPWATARADADDGHFIIDDLHRYPFLVAGRPRRAWSAHAAPAPMTGGDSSMPAWSFQRGTHADGPTMPPLHRTRRAKAWMLVAFSPLSAPAWRRCAPAVPQPLGSVIDLRYSHQRLSSQSRSLSSGRCASSSFEAAPAWIGIAGPAPPRRGIRGALHRGTGRGCRHRR